MNNRVLITGISGFLGSQIAQKLYDNGFELIVSPNPATNLFRINYTSDRNQTAEINVTNSIGSVVYRSTEQVNTGINEWMVTEASKWSPGQYVIQCKVGDEIFRKRIVVAH